MQWREMETGAETVKKLDKLESFINSSKRFYSSETVWAAHVLEILVEIVQKSPKIDAVAYSFHAVFCEQNYNWRLKLHTKKYIK